MTFLLWCSLMAILIFMIGSKHTIFCEILSWLICSSIERLSEDSFNLFLKILNEKCDNFLYKCSEQMTQLDLFFKLESDRKYVLEKADRECMKQKLFDFSHLIEYLSWKQWLWNILFISVSAQKTCWQASCREIYYQRSGYSLICNVLVYRRD